MACPGSPTENILVIPMKFLSGKVSFALRAVYSELSGYMFTEGKKS